jgi:hypothetical protein
MGQCERNEKESPDSLTKALIGSRPYKVNSLNGNKSTTEHLAKNLRQKMWRDEERLRK